VLNPNFNLFSLHLWFELRVNPDLQLFYNSFYNLLNFIYVKKGIFIVHICQQN